MFEEAKVVLVEDVQDSNPNLYVERAEEALKNGRYEDALKEIDQAISFSDGQVNYKYEKVKILAGGGRSGATLFLCSELKMNNCLAVNIIL